MPSILTVDDSPSMRKMIASALAGAGFDVVEAVDGEDGFAKAVTRDVALVLADQNMPRLDGIGLTCRLRDQRRFRALPILILTTEWSEQMKQAGRDAGATGWLVKPFDPVRLVEAVNQVLCRDRPIGLARKDDGQGTDDDG